MPSPLPSPSRLDALYQLIAWARGDHKCKRCDGSGAVLVQYGDHPTMDYEDCPVCAGEGEVDV